MCSWNVAVFPQYAGLRWFGSSIRGLFTCLGEPASVSEGSVCRVCEAVWQSCAAGTALSLSYLLSCPKLALGNKCCFVNVLRGAVKRTMLWKNWIFSWICCSLTEWENDTFVLVLKWHLFQKLLNVKVPYSPQLSSPMCVSLLPCLRSEVSNSF